MHSKNELLIVSLVSYLVTYSPKKCASAQFPALSIDIEFFCYFKEKVIKINPLVPDAHYNERQDNPFS